MRKGTAFLVTLLIMLLLAFTLGAVLVRRGRPSEQHQLDMEALHLKTAAKMQAIKVGFWGALAAVALLGTAGIVAGLARAAWLRSRLIHPHANGLFPVVRGRIGGQTYYHDPNRQLASSVAYGSDQKGVFARHLMPPDNRGEQLQVTTQAQAAQLTAAATQGRGLTAQSRRLAERVALTTASYPVPRLPEIVVPEAAIPEERHLLTALRQDWEDD
jgi:hypothetical protein